MRIPRLSPVFFLAAALLSLPGASKAQTFSGDFSLSSGSVYHNPAAIQVNSLAVDTVSASGPFVYATGVVPLAGLTIKLSSGGVGITSAPFSNGGTGAGQDVAVDPSGNVWVAGYIQTAGPVNNWIVQKYDADLVLIASHVVTGFNPVGEEARSIVFDSSGNAFVVGLTSSVPRMMKYSPSLVVLASTTLGGTTSYYVEETTLDSSGNAIAAGTDYSSGSGRYWTVKVDPSLVFLASATFVDGSSYSWARGVTADPSGNIYVTGVSPTGGNAAFKTVKYDGNLTQLGVVSHDSPANDEGRDAMFVGTNTLVVVGFTHGGGTADWLVLTYDAGLVLISSRTYDRGEYDAAYAVAKGTGNYMYVSGTSQVSSDSPLRVIRMTVNGMDADAPPSYPGCVVTNNVGSGQTYSTIQSAVDALPPSLTGHSCVVIRDGATYAEQVAVRNFTNNGYSVSILADPASGLTPVVSPPAASTAAFQIANASVSVTGVAISPANAIPYGVFVSSAHVSINSVSVQDAGGKIAAAGIAASSWTTVSRTSITVGGASATGIWLAGSVGATVSFSSVTANGSAAYAMRLSGASSNTVTESLLINLPGSGLHLLNSNGNVISRSSIACDNGTGSNAALYLTNSSSNSVTQTFLRNWYADAVSLNSGSNYNSITQSTAVLRGAGGQAAIGLNSSHHNNVAGCLLSVSGGVGINIGASNFNTVSQTTMAVTNGMGRQALLFNVASSNTVTSSYIANPQETGISYFNGSSYNAVSQSVILGGPSSNLYPSGVYITNGSFNTISQSRISNPGGFGATFGTWAMRNTISLSTITSGAAGYPGVYFMAGSGTNTVSGSYVQGSTAAYVVNVQGAVIDSSVLAGGAMGPGIFLDYGSSGTIILSGNSITGALHGLRISTQSAFLSISSISFTGLASSATAVRFLGGTFVATVTAASFDASASVNVDAAALNPASRLTLMSAFGARAGEAYENDPGSLVDWLGMVPFTPTALAASGVGLGAATLSWASGGNPAGTVYELERSSGPGFGLRKSTTATVFVDAALSAGGTYYYRVRALNAELVASAYSSTITVVTYPVPARPAVSAIVPSSGTTGASFAAAVAGSGFTSPAVLSLERPLPDLGSWAPTGSLAQARMAGTLTKLYDGRVLYAGGMLEGSAIGLTTVEIYDPASGTWTAGPPLRVGRNQYNAVTLADGRVLVAGGRGPTGAMTSSVEIYDPVISTWTTAAPMTVRGAFALAPLPDGRVLAAGGWDGVNALKSAEIYDPATDAWTAAAAMGTERVWPGFIAVDGKVLISGGSAGTGISNAEIYDPATNTWSAAGTMNAPRYLHKLAVLPGGKVLAAGGLTADASDVYDLATGSWTPTGPLGVRRYVESLVLVNGSAMIIGGENTATDHASTEIYDASSNTWRAGPALAGTRTWLGAVALDDGRVLAAAGRRGLGGGTNLNSAELLSMPTAQILATGVAVTNAQNLGGTFSLAGAATGYWDVVVRGPGSRGERLSGGFLTVAQTPLPGAPSGFAGAAQTDGAILWSWTDNASNELGFRVLFGTTVVSGNLAANATGWIQTGLAPNASYGPMLAQAVNSSGTAESGTASARTFAAVPGAPVASGVAVTSAAVSWSDGGNPAGTVFRLERSTGTGYGLRFSSAATSFFDADLTPAATHLYRVLAVNGDSVATAYSSTLAVVASPLPGAPGASGIPAGTALGTSSAAWTWTLSPGASSYNLFRSSDNGYHASASSGALTLTGLAPNTPYGLRAAGVNIGGMGPLSAAATVYTLAAAPSGTGTAVTSTTIVASWSLNGNAAATVAELLRSTDSVVFSTLTAAAVTVYTDADLLGCTTYYYRVRNVNGDGLPTDFASFQGVTANTVPSPPAGLTASANAGGTVSLAWSLSPTEGVTGYRLYWDAGTGTVSYGAPLAVLGSTATAFTTGVLTSSGSYTFALRAAHRCGVMETTGALAMSGAAVALPPVRAAIKEPDSGRRINGDRVTILGELISGTPSDAQQVLFQYKAAASSVWLSVPAANINHSNPDLAFPYFVHWDVTALAAGSYDLRAVAYDLSGVPDPAPPAVRVVVDPVTPDISETLTAGGKIKKDQTVSNAVISVVETAGAGAGDPAVRVTLPPGVVNTTTATLSVISNPAIATAAPAGQTMVGSAIRIGLSNGQTALAGTAAIVMTYPDTVRFPSLLQIYYLNEATGAWSRDFTTTVDAASRTVTGNTPHFSTFVLMLGTAFSANLDSVQVYPVPYKPNGTNPDEGRPFSHGDANSGIFFANLASASEITIYTLSGRMVSKLDSPSIAGTLRWDARNQDGRDVASGAYFAVITAPGQKSVVKKLVIIR